MPDSNDAAIAAFEAWCEELAATKARNAVPGEPAAPLVNATLVTPDQLVGAFLAAHSDFADAKDALESFASGSGGLDVDKARWDAVSGA